MTNVEFDEERSGGGTAYGSRRILGAYQIPGMVGILQRMGIVRNEEQGYWLLLGAVVVSIAASIIILALFVFHVNVGDPFSSSQAPLAAQTNFLRKMQGVSHPQP